MKIGILTIPTYHNYGGILQNYALQQILKKLGYEVEWIRLAYDKNKMSFNESPIFYLKDKLKFILGKKKWDQRIYRKTHIYVERFIQQYLQQTHICYLNKNFKQLSQGYDIYLVGSDQVWRIPYCIDIETYFLNFVKGDSKHIKRLSYAASFGTEEAEFSKKQIEACGNLIKKFNGVSVREHSAIKLIKETYNWDCDPVWVLDPTMLLKASDYRCLAEPDFICPNELFYYILDPDESKTNIIKYAEELLDLKPFTVYFKSQREKCPIQEKIIPPVEKWIAAFQSSKFVITDSFHGCVFSILFNKPFIVCKNESRGMTRIESLLDMFNLNDRLVDSQLSNINTVMKQDPDWDKVNEKLDEWRDKSISFLKFTLSN